MSVLAAQVSDAVLSVARRGGKTLAATTRDIASLLHGPHSGSGPARRTGIQGDPEVRRGDLAEVIEQFQ